MSAGRKKKDETLVKTCDTKSITYITLVTRLEHDNISEMGD